MPAPTHTRTTHPATGSVEVRLPWWAIALPALAFAALLLLIVGTGEAHAATTDPAVGRLLARIAALVTG
ncbi:hypothetical protein OH786_07250 [Streptomyces atratus]|jgi:hypothetical protein|uniref:Uncharacterized protein n=1 Tax=Streptomyces atratus TaxID=1893 RepID=A0A1K1TCU2_STRAR|nr:hypothetical protein [Streptomyces atratus]SFW98457.1 hypothetical protein SAMN02787144_100116 [Streptomyces atratus]